MEGFYNSAVKYVRSAAFFALLLLTTFSLDAAELRIRAIDLLTMDPVAGAKVTVRARVFEQHENGERRLLPLGGSIYLFQTITASDGTANMSLDGDDASLFVVEVLARGFVSQVESMFRITHEEMTEREFHLIRENLTPQQAEQLVDAQEVVRASDYVEQEMIDVPEPDLRAFAAVNVPNQVYVEDLAGFSGMMDLDEYIAGVVTAEMNDGFPREALRSQAVAARSYALARLRARGYANGGQAYRSTYGTLSRAASLFTKKQVLLYNGTIANAYFSARCNGDFTLNSEDGPTLTACRRGGLGGGVVPYCRSRPCSGHVNCSQTSEQCCVVTISNKTNYIYGHGVGMCQRGAQGFANQGWLYPRILTNYYTGIVLHTGTNALQLTLVRPTGTSTNLAVQVRSGQADTFFDLQSTTSLSSPTWTTASGEARLNTGPTRVVQIQSRAGITQQRYFRAVLRD
ncbi:MAG TPA: SpoIID/LytB domain-containing protein [Verrucomicrobiae bacterium]